MPRPPRSGSARPRRFPAAWLLAAIGIAVLVLLIHGVAAQVGRPEIVVYKSPSCGCCAAWVEHLRARGFTVSTRDVADVAAVRRQSRVPETLAACHTATVGPYVIEGHVPAREIDRLLTERPPVAGLAVAGMPLGSPGMERGARHEPYDVVAFDAAGGTRVFATYR